ncbi:MAG: TIGR01777 family oxidoreductase [Actinomycetes bacterium]
MKIAITGASGFLGRALVAALHERGDTPILFARTATAERNVVRWQPSAGDVNREDLARVGSIDAFVHLAGAGIADKRWTTSRKKEILDSRTEGTALLARTITGLETPPSVVLSGSAIGFYGSRGDEILTEASSRGEGFLADVCEAWESAALPVHEAGITLTLLRTGIVMGSSGGALKKQLPLFRAGVGGRLGSGRQFLSPISLQDEIQAMLFLLDNPIAGPVNLVSPEPITNRTFTAALGAAVHRPSVAAVPRLALDIALGSELVSEALLASQRVVPSVLETRGFIFQHRTIEQVLTAALRN